MQVDYVQLPIRYGTSVLSSKNGSFTNIVIFLFSSKNRLLIAFCKRAFFCASVCGGVALEGLEFFGGVDFFVVAEFGDFFGTTFLAAGVETGGEVNVVTLLAAAAAGDF